jgi:hypothetical protein
MTCKKKYYTKVNSDMHFKGDVLLLGPGFYDWKDLQAKHFDDRIESIFLTWATRPSCANTRASRASAFGSSTRTGRSTSETACLPSRSYSGSGKPLNLHVA